MTLSGLFSRWKSKPEEPGAALWAHAFTLGFSKAWDLMVPLMREGMAKSYQTVLDEAAEQTLAGLEGVILQRLAEAQQYGLQPINAVLAKRDEFRKRRAIATSDEDRAKYDNFLSCLEWFLQTIPVTENGN